MYDYLLSFTTKQAAVNALTPLELNAGSDIDRAIATEVQMIQQEGTYQEDGTPVLPWKFYPGYNIQLFSKERNPALEALPQCRIGACRELFEAGEEYIVYKAADFNKAMLQIKIIGGFYTYPFGQVQ